MRVYLTEKAKKEKKLEQLTTILKNKKFQKQG